MSQNYKITYEKILAILKDCVNIADVLRKLNASVTTGNYRTFHNLRKKHNIDTSHFLGQKSGLIKVPKFILPIEDLLIENSGKVMRSSTKNRILSLKLLENKCALCPITNMWNGKPIVLQLDHINGINDDHRIENLRLLCPNCHSQTSTFCGRNKTQNDDLKLICECGNAKLIASNQCMDCANTSKRNKRTKINWPTDNILINLILETNTSQVGRQLGVSDSGIRKRLKVRGLLEKIKK